MMKRARLMAGLTPHEFGTLRAHSRSRRDERGPEIAAYRLDDRVLRRFSRRKCSLSHGQRDLPVGNPRTDHRDLLRHRNWPWGVAAPLVFGKLIESGSRQSIFGGYVFAAVLMFAAAIVAARYAVNAERKPLEQVGDPPLGSDLKAVICAGSERALDLDLVGSQKRLNRGVAGAMRPSRSPRSDGSAWPSSAPAQSMSSSLAL